MVNRRGQVLQDPPFVQWLLTNPRAGWLWIIPRVWLGWQWLQSGLGKFANPAWTDTGAALQGFWKGAVQVPAQGKPPITFDWYRSFLQTLLDAQAYTWFAKLVVAGELIVGVLLIVGAFTGIAAFIGGFMNWNFMMAGTASTNPLFFLIAVGLILAWKVSGHIGLDRYLLPLIGTPWQPGVEIRREGPVFRPGALGESRAPAEPKE